MEITTIGPFLHYFERVRGRTLRVFACIPPDQVEWRPALDRFSFGDVLRHLAGIERFMYVENVVGRPSRYPGHGEALAAGYEGVLEYAGRLHREAGDVLSALTDADLQQKVETPAGTPITAWKLLRAMVEHEAHHRGQLYLMLGLLGIATPPVFGLTAEEVLASSIGGTAVP